MGGQRTVAVEDICVADDCAAHIIEMIRKQAAATQLQRNGHLPAVTKLYAHSQRQLPLGECIRCCIARQPLPLCTQRLHGYPLTVKKYFGIEAVYTAAAEQEGG